MKNNAAVLDIDIFRFFQQSRKGENLHYQEPTRFRFKFMKTAITCLALTVMQLSGYSQPVKATQTPAAPAAASAVVPPAGQW